MEMMGYALATIAGITWGTLGIASYLLKSTGIGSFEVAFLRLVFAFIMMFIFFYVKDKSVLKVNKEGMKHSVLIGVVSQGIMSLAFYKCIEMTSTTTAVVMVCLGPLFTAILSRFFFKEKFTFFKTLALSMAFYGCFLVVTGGKVETFNTNGLGLAIGVVSAVAYGFFPIFSKRVPVSCNSLGILMYSFLIGAIFVIPFMSFKVLLVFFTWKLLIYSIILGIVPTILSYGFYSVSIRYITPTKASILTLIEIPVAACIGHIFLREHLGSINVLGIVILLCGTIISKFEMPIKPKNIRASIKR